MQVSEYMFNPILYVMARKLVKNGKTHVTQYLPNYVSFRMALGMVNPPRIDDIWDLDALAYNPQPMSSLGKNSGTCTRQWADAWVVGARGGGGPLGSGRQLPSPIDRWPEAAWGGGAEIGGEGVKEGE